VPSRHDGAHGPAASLGAVARVLVVNFVSLDGVIQSPLSADEDADGGFAAGGWVPPYGDDTMASFMSEATTAAAGMLLGRRSYEIFTTAWSGADQSDPAVAAMNRMPKYVVTRSPDVPLSWGNSRRLGGPADVARLKGEVDGDLVVFGSGGLLGALAEQDLVDEYRLLLFPVILGAGKRMFGDGSPLTHLTLTASTTTSTGVVLLTYTRP
jgi:dihydrofolate reductase